MATLKKRSERNEHDTYETPEHIVRAFLDLVPINPSWTYREPCRASGRFYNHMPIGSSWGEIRQGVDYLTTEYPDRVDCILTNPPFLLAKEFILKAKEEADVVIMLLRMGFLESKKRKEFWKENPIQHLVTISERPSFTGDGKTDGAAYGFFIWDEKGRLGLEKPFYWI